MLIWHRHILRHFFLNQRVHWTLGRLCIIRVWIAENGRKSEPMNHRSCVSDKRIWTVLYILIRMISDYYIVEYCPLRQWILCLYVDWLESLPFMCFFEVQWEQKISYIVLHPKKYTRFHTISIDAILHYFENYVQGDHFFPRWDFLCENQIWPGESKMQTIVWYLIMFKWMEVKAYFLKQYSRNEILCYLPEQI